MNDIIPKQDRNNLTEIDNRILRAGLDPYEIRIYLELKYIAIHSNICSISVKDLAENCSISERKVHSSLDQLYKINKILNVPLLKKISKRKPDGGNDSNFYIIEEI